MMTTFAALFGALPLAFGTGEGSELRHPLGVTIVGGLIVSQVLTLYTTPVVFLYLDRFGKGLGRLWNRYYLCVNRRRLRGVMTQRGLTATVASRSRCACGLRAGRARILAGRDRSAAVQGDQGLEGRDPAAT